MSLSKEQADYCRRSGCLHHEDYAYCQCGNHHVECELCGNTTECFDHGCKLGCKNGKAYWNVDKNEN